MVSAPGLGILFKVTQVFRVFLITAIAKDHKELNEPFSLALALACPGRDDLLRLRTELWNNICRAQEQIKWLLVESKC